MRAAFRILAILIAAEVVVQAAAIAYAVFGLGHWVDEGGTLNKATMEGDSLPFPEVVGFIVHGINGEIVVPLLAVALLVVAFFARVAGGVRWAGLTLAFVVVQVLLGVFSHSLPVVGLLHGGNALVVFGLAVMTAMAAKKSAAPVDADRQAAVA